MPLPFSFSTQRQASTAEMTSWANEVSAAVKVMSHAPGHVSTEPLSRTPGSYFSPSVPGGVPHARSDHPSLTPDRASSPPSTSQGMIGQMSAVTMPLAPAAPPQFQGGAGEWNAQMEQLRNDLFGVAMSVSALNDRLDRLEARAPAGGPSMQAGLATLRGEIESWLENHLGVAVEHCMQRILSRPGRPDSTPVS